MICVVCHGTGRTVVRGPHGHKNRRTIGIDVCKECVGTGFTHCCEGLIEQPENEELETITASPAKAAALAIAFMLCAATVPAANAQILIPGTYPLSLNQSADQSGLVISSANQGEVPPSPPYGDQGYTINAWANCNCVGNPDLANDDLVRITGYNHGTGPAQVNGMSVYMVGGAINAPHIGQTTGLHVETVSTNSGSVWGIDVETADSPFLTGYSGPQRYIANEFDAQIGGTQTIATLLALGGTILTNPAYGAGISLNYIGAGKITEFLFSHDGMANVGLHLGRFSKELHPNDGSQSIQMDWSDSKGNPNSLSLTAYNDTMVLQTTDKAAPASYAVDGAAGIYAKVHVSSTCLLDISGGLVTGTEGQC